MGPSGRGQEKRRRAEREKEMKRRERWEEEFLKNEAELSRSAKTPAAMAVFKRSEKNRRRQFFAQKEAEQELERKKSEEQQEHFVVQAPRQISGERSRREERVSREPEKEDRRREEPLMDDTDFEAEGQSKPPRKEYERITIRLEECSSYEETSDEEEAENEEEEE